MTADVRYQVFVSSTYEDLREERQQATQAILEMNHMPSGMELFPASDLSQWELIKTVINECDYYVVIVGGRYGSVHKSTGLSFTEMEYDYATAQGVPVLGFIRKDLKKVASEFVETDPVARAKLEAFREKVMSRTCRQFDEPVELGMMVMKSLMNEMRTNPRIGWVRANQARGKEDIEREQALMDEVTAKDKAIKKLERQVRDRSVPLQGIDRGDLAQGSDVYRLTATFQDRNKRLVSTEIPLSWDEIFSVIAPAMYGYILRKGAPGYNKLVGSYSFEGGLIEYVRTRIVDQCGTRQINILPHQIDDILIQFRQLGLMAMVEKTKEDDGEDFRGYSLTSAGEEYLTRLKVKVKGVPLEEATELIG
ncbi:MAG TPA: DUF4062 domain-containing protein [Sphingomicrobium sp.]|nr:DUF4062 domain-containing protein [Sphingomicrobium sp.]